MKGADYVIKRVGFAVLTVFIAVTINFVLFRLAPGSAVTNLARVPHATPETRHALEKQFGLDKSKFQQYLIYLQQLAHGNLGISFANSQPVSKNLTGDNDTGLGKWVAMDVQNCLLMGKSKDGTGICPPMPLAVYKTMTKQDATDIANYIKSLPPIVHNVPDMCVFPPVASDGGADGTTDSGATETEPEAGPADAGDETGG